MSFPGPLVFDLLTRPNSAPVGLLLGVCQTKEERYVTDANEDEYNFADTFHIQYCQAIAPSVFASNRQLDTVKFGNWFHDLIMSMSRGQKIVGVYRVRSNCPQLKHFEHRMSLLDKDVCNVVSGHIKATMVFASVYRDNSDGVLSYGLRNTLILANPEEDQSPEVVVSNIHNMRGHQNKLELQNAAHVVVSRNVSLVSTKYASLLKRQEELKDDKSTNGLRDACSADLGKLAKAIQEKKAKRNELQEKLKVLNRNNRKLQSFANLKISEASREQQVMNNISNHHGPALGPFLSQGATRRRIRVFNLDDEEDEDNCSPRKFKRTSSPQY